MTRIRKEGDVEAAESAGPSPTLTEAGMLHTTRPKRRKKEGGNDTLGFNNGFALHTRTNRDVARPRI